MLSMIVVPLRYSLVSLFD